VLDGSMRPTWLLPFAACIHRAVLACTPVVSRASRLLNVNRPCDESCGLGWEPHRMTSPHGVLVGAPTRFAARLAVPASSKTKAETPAPVPRLIPMTPVSAEQRVQPHSKPLGLPAVTTAPRLQALRTGMAFAFSANLRFQRQRPAARPPLALQSDPPTSND
jgi:hypothetical protein